MTDFPTQDIFLGGADRDGNLAQAYRRALMKAAPSDFTIEVLPPTKHGSSCHYGLKICPRTNSDSPKNSEKKHVTYEIWRRWEDCLDFQRTLEIEFSHLMKRRRKGKGKQSANTLYPSDRAASFESLPSGPALQFANDLQVYLPKLSKKSSLFRANQATITQRGDEFRDLMLSLTADDAHSVVRELRETPSVREFFGYWRRDKEAARKSGKPIPFPDPVPMPPNGAFLLSAQNNPFLGSAVSLSFMQGSSVSLPSSNSPAVTRSLSPTPAPPVPPVSRDLPPLAGQLRIPNLKTPSPMPPAAAAAAASPPTPPKTSPSFPPPRGAIPRSSSGEKLHRRTSTTRPSTSSGAFSSPKASAPPRPAPAPALNLRNSVDPVLLRTPARKISVPSDFSPSLDGPPSASLTETSAKRRASVPKAPGPPPSSPPPVSPPPNPSDRARRSDALDSLDHEEVLNIPLHTFPMPPAPRESAASSQESVPGARIAFPPVQPLKPKLNRMHPPGSWRPQRQSLQDLRIQTQKGIAPALADIDDQDTITAPIPRAPRARAGSVGQNRNARIFISTPTSGQLDSDNEEEQMAIPAASTRRAASTSTTTSSSHATSHSVTSENSVPALSSSTTASSRPSTGHSSQHHHHRISHQANSSIGSMYSVDSYMSDPEMPYYRSIAASLFPNSSSSTPKPRLSTSSIESSYTTDSSSDAVIPRSMFVPPPPRPPRSQLRTSRALSDAAQHPVHPVIREEPANSSSPPRATEEFIDSYFSIGTAQPDDNSQLSVTAAQRSSSSDHLSTRSVGRESVSSSVGGRESLHSSVSSSSNQYPKPFQNRPPGQFHLPFSTTPPASATLGSVIPSPFTPSMPLSPSSDALPKSTTPSSSTFPDMFPVKVIYSPADAIVVFRAALSIGLVELRQRIQQKLLDAEGIDLDGVPFALAYLPSRSSVKSSTLPYPGPPPVTSDRPSTGRSRSGSVASSTGSVDVSQMVLLATEAHWENAVGSCGGKITLRVLLDSFLSPA